jgi:hypothetical protein
MGSWDIFSDECGLTDGQTGPNFVLSGVAISNNNKFLDGNWTHTMDDTIMDHDEPHSSRVNNSITNLHVMVHPVRFFVRSFVFSFRSTHCASSTACSC